MTDTTTASIDPNLGLVSHALSLILQMERTAWRHYQHCVDEHCGVSLHRLREDASKHLPHVYFGERDMAKAIIKGMPV